MSQGKVGRKEKCWKAMGKLLLLSSILFFPGSSTALAQSHLNKVKSAAEYASLKGLPAVRKYGRVESVKVVWAREKDEVYFLNAEKWEWHYDFCHEVLGFWQKRFVFNDQVYNGSEVREFVVGNVNHYPDAGHWTLEFSPADQIRPALIEAFYQCIAKSLFSGDELALFLNTQRLEELFGDGDAPFPIVVPEDIYAGQLYQPLVEGTAYGYLRKMTVEELKEKHPGPRDIVLVNGTPLDIPPTAAVLTNQFQTPLSHLNVLCQNRKTPFFAHKEIWEHPVIDSLEWELVRLTVGPDSFRIEKAEIEMARLSWAARRPSKQVKLRVKLDREDLVPGAKLHPRMVDEVGGKAANFGALVRIAKRDPKGFWVPENAFAIPFHWYFDHMRRSGAGEMVQELLTDEKARSNPQELEIRLKAIRKQIKSTGVNPELLNRVHLQAGPGRHRLRFRSSTNAEDVDGFNGAGLYSSKTGWVGAPEEKKQAGKAIAKVWASVWNFRAFQEREYFGIPQEFVAMGILVHRSFPNESANGVAITKNLYRKGYYGYVVNVQMGEVSVVSPPEGVTCDQLICYAESDLSFFKERGTVEYISHTSLKSGEPVLTKDQVVFLTEQLARIKKYYYWNVGGNSRKYDYKDFGLDIEFKIDGPDDRLYIKQVRIYND